MAQFCTFKEWETYKNMPYEEKLEWSTNIIIRAIKSSNIHSVSLSWGKDSVVMLHLIRTICHKSLVVFADTGIEYPETYTYRDKMLKEVFNEDIKYFETKPIKTFWKCVEEYGYPHNRKEKGKVRQPRCCIYLKEKPLDDFQKENAVDTIFMGLQGTESMNRRRLFMRLGGYYHRKTTHQWVCLPLAIWTNDDVKRYVKENNVPINPLYSKMDRTGCMFCTGFKNWKKVMASYKPAHLKLILKKKEGQDVLHECYTEDEVNGRASSQQ